MPNLKYLTIRYSLLGDSFLEGLQELEHNIEYLEIANSNITDAGLQHLSSFGNLREVYLNLNAITDAGLDNFPLLYGLGIISFENTRVTSEAVKKLEERLPGTRVKN